MSRVELTLPADQAYRRKVALFEERAAWQIGIRSTDTPQFLQVIESLLYPEDEERLVALLAEFQQEGCLPFTPAELAWQLECCVSESGRFDEDAALILRPVLGKAAADAMVKRSVA